VRTPIVTFATLTILLLLPGCAANEREQLLASQKLFAATVDTLTLMRQAGDFDAAQIERLNIIIHQGGDFLATWEWRVLAGQQSPGARDQFQTILEALQEYHRKEVEPNEPNE